jgi:indole-3-acetate monooxygenase
LSVFTKTVDYPGFEKAPRSRTYSPEGVAAIKAARAMRPLLRASAESIETNQKLPAPVVDAMAEAGLLVMAAPDDVGGGVIDYPAQFRVLEEIACGDSSAGWCLLTHMAGAALSSRLSLAGAQRLWRSKAAVVAGSPVAGGRAMRVDNGLRVLSGEWRFASNFNHATHYLGGVQLVESEDDPGAAWPPDPQSGRMPIMGCVYFSPDQVRFVPGSAETTGLRGTCSGAYRVKEALVPEDWTFMMFGGPSSLATTGPLGIGGHAAVTLGIARHALESFYNIARTKKGMGVGRNAPIQDNPVVQHELAKCEVQLRAARALFFEIIEDCWARWCDGEEVTASDYLASEMSNVNAARVCRSVIDTLHSWAGSSAVFKGAPFERLARDMLTAGAHMAIQMNNFETYGRALLWMDVMMMSAFEAANITASSGRHRAKKRETELA